MVDPKMIVTPMKCQARKRRTYRGADLRIPDERFAKKQTPECGVKFHARISSSTVGPRKSPRKSPRNVQVSRDVDRPVTIKARIRLSAKKDYLLEKTRVIEANERNTGCSDKTLDESQKTRSRKKAKAENKRANDTSAPTTTQHPNDASQNSVKCYGCWKEDVIRKNYVNGAEWPAVKIVIGGVPGTAYLDSGAKASLASPEPYKVLKNQGYRFKKVPINLIQADGSSRPAVVQSTRASVLVNGKKIPTNFMAIPGSPEAKTLLGVDFLNEAGLVIDYKNHRWHFSGKRHETYGFVHKDDNSRTSLP
ncbi:hypothetical protein GEV33_006122 [Tenebrio molitor]|uniref:Uncharacterized protein n=1 Tax=Tenebrio molitor TaxID=7067 RepID=A0A8J6LC28_TENMO|nr:hypothetical protein GEV33_006122 [Tenebrio molitor]